MAAPPSTRLGPGIEPRWALWTGGGAIALIAALAPDRGGHSLALLAIGCLLGFALFAATFGFAAANRDLVVRRRTDGLVAQLVMVGAATILFAPALAAGEIFGRPVTGAYAPVAVQVAVGAALFGIGMQLAGGCGSGALFALGGGSARMVLVVVFFCAGSFAASLHMDFWQRLPSLGTVVLGRELGWAAATAAQTLAVAGAAVLLSRWAANSPWRLLPKGKRWWRGPWPLAFGALALAVLNFATLATAGHPWSITWAFTLWGGKAALAAGWDPTASAFWMSDFARRALESPILADTTTIMNVGIVLGALCAAGASGRFAPRVGLNVRNATTAVLGGIAMGYGARIAFGCNIGAFFSGAASTSLHGWLWFAAALLGSAVAIKASALVARRAA